MHNRYAYFAAFLTSYILFGCVPSSTLVIDVGIFSNIATAKHAVEITEKALFDLKLTQHAAKSNSGSSNLGKTEDERFIFLEFDDPVAPQDRPSETWVVVIQLTKKENSVKILLSQPGANKPSDAMIKRHEELFVELQRLLIDFKLKKLG